MNTKTETKNVNRIDANLYDALLKQGVNLEELNVVVKGTRVKTDAKLTEMEKQAPKMFKAYMQMKAIHETIVGKTFSFFGTLYKITLTIKKA